MSDDAAIVVEGPTRVTIPESELSFTYARSSGPGGQKVNKAETKVVLYWSVTASTSLPEAMRHRFRQRYQNRINKDGLLVVGSDRFRDRERNRDDCLEKLRSMLQAVARPPKKRKPTRPSRSAKEARLRDKKERGEKKRSRKKPNMD